MRRGSPQWKPSVGTQPNLEMLQKRGIRYAWTMNEGAGSLILSQVNQLPLVFVGGVDWIPGQYGPAVRCDGTTGYLNGGTLVNPLGGGAGSYSKLTLALSVNLDSLTNGVCQALISKRTSFNSNVEFGLSFNSGALNMVNGLGFEVNGDGTGNVAGGVTTYPFTSWVGTWHRIVVTYSAVANPNVAFYIDGRFIANDVTLNFNGSISSKASKFYVGGLNDPPGAFLAGNADNVIMATEIWNQDVVTQDYIDAFAGMSSPPSMKGAAIAANLARNRMISQAVNRAANY